ncbi:MAG: hypothetical protein WC757_02360 [Candidatus Paceibacterota bacterium]|jgi:hypothetical protein
MLLRFRWLIFLAFFLIIIVCGLFAVRFFFGGSEDMWICVNNEWVAHGNPSADKPVTGCEARIEDSTSYADTVGEVCGSVPKALVINSTNLSDEDISERLLRQWFNFYLNPSVCLSERLSAYTIDSVTVKVSRLPYMATVVEYSVAPKILPSTYWLGETSGQSNWIKMKATLDIGRSNQQYVLKGVIDASVVGGVPVGASSTITSSTTPLDSIVEPVADDIMVQ